MAAEVGYDARMPRLIALTLATLCPLAPCPALAYQAAVPAPRGGPGTSFTETQQYAHHQHQPPLLGAASAKVVAAGGDLDGDGVEDVLIGEPEHVVSGNQNAGRVLAISGATGCLLAIVTNPAASPGGDLFGSSVLGVGDVDGDGYGDFAVGTVRSNVQSPGNVRIYSGAGGGGIGGVGPYQQYSYFQAGSNHQGSGGDKFGQVMARVDLNFDGVPELIVGAPKTPWVNSGATGEVHVYNVTTFVAGPFGTPVPQHRNTLHPPDSQDGHQNFGISVSAAGDIDGDLFRDLVVGANWSNANGLGYAEVYSGAPTYNGASTAAARIVRLSLPPNDPQGGPEDHGETVSGLGDLDGDGRPEVGVAAPREDVTGVGSNVGVVRVYRITGSGPYSATVIREIVSEQRILADIGDVYPFHAPDGRGDLLLGTTELRIYDGVTATEKRSFASDVAGEAWGTSYAILGDLNGDNTRDLVVAGDETVGVLSIKKLGNSLVASPSSITTSFGGVVTLSLDLGLTLRQDTYQVLGTRSGTSPGQAFGAPSFHLSLNPDAWFTQTLTSPNLPPLIATSGTLDGSGRAAAALSIGGAFSPGCYHHAVVTANPGGGSTTGAGRPAVINVLP